MWASSSDSRGPSLRRSQPMITPELVLLDQVHVDAAREDLPLWCGRCHPHTRVVADDLDRPEPCADCYPRTRGWSGRSERDAGGGGGGGRRPRTRGEGPGMGWAV